MGGLQLHASHNSKDADAARLLDGLRTPPVSTAQIQQPSKAYNPQQKQRLKGRYTEERPSAWRGASGRPPSKTGCRSRYTKGRPSAARSPQGINAHSNSLRAAFGRPPFMTMATMQMQIYGLGLPSTDGKDKDADADAHTLSSAHFWSFSIDDQKSHPRTSFEIHGAVLRCFARVLGGPWGCFWGPGWSGRVHGEVFGSKGASGGVLERPLKT